MLNEIYIRNFIKKTIIREYNSHNKSLKVINEDVNLSNKTIINVDIQPEYESYVSFNLNKWVEFINKSSENNKIIFLYNGADTLGMVNKNDFIYWLLEKGVNEDLLDNAIFYDKGYAFFRYCMDSSIDENSIVDLIKFMANNNINDSRYINTEMWNKFMKDMNYSQSDIRDLLENADDMIFIPDLMDFLKNYNNIVLTGGGINECLKEVELALMALNKNYNILSEYTY